MVSLTAGGGKDAGGAAGIHAVQEGPNLAKQQQVRAFLVYSGVVESIDECLSKPYKAQKTWLAWMTYTLALVR
jgi:hypothetical protein